MVCIAILINLYPSLWCELLSGTLEVNDLLRDTWCVVHPNSPQHNDEQVKPAVNKKENWISSSPPNTPQHQPGPRDSGYPAPVTLVNYAPNVHAEIRYEQGSIDGAYMGADGMYCDPDQPIFFIIAYKVTDHALTFKILECLHKETRWPSHPLLMGMILTVLSSSRISFMKIVLRGKRTYGTPPPLPTEAHLSDVI